MRKKVVMFPWADVECCTDDGGFLLGSCVYFPEYCEIQADVFTLGSGWGDNFDHVENSVYEYGHMTNTLRGYGFIPFLTGNAYLSSMDTLLEVVSDAF